MRGLSVFVVAVCMTALAIVRWHPEWVGLPARSQAIQPAPLPLTKLDQCRAYRNANAPFFRAMGERGLAMEQASPEDERELLAGLQRYLDGELPRLESMYVGAEVAPVHVSLVSAVHRLRASVASMVIAIDHGDFPGYQAAVAGAGETYGALGAVKDQLVEVCG